MFCTNCGKKLGSESRTCSDCGHESKPIVKKKNNWLWNIGKVFIILLIIGSISNFFVDDKLSEEEVEDFKTVIDDAVKGTNNTSAEYDAMREVMTDIIEYARNDAQAITEAEGVFEEYDFLAISSFKSKARMQEIIEEVNLYSDAFNDFFSRRDKAYQDMVVIINKSNMTAQDKEDMLSGFKYSPEYKRIESQLITEVNRYINDINNFYSFMIRNFNSYEIALDEYYEETVFLETDSLVNQYNNLNTALLDSGTSVSTLYEEYIQLGQQRFDSLGVDMDYEKMLEDIYYNQN